jgi:hypothetical protein
MAGGTGTLKTLLAGAVALLAVSGEAATAAGIVDLPTAAPLGAVVVDNDLGRAYFSLGNGRALSYVLAGGAEGDDNSLQDAVLQGDGSLEPSRLSRRNLRWRR